MTDEEFEERQEEILDLHRKAERVLDANPKYVVEELEKFAAQIKKAVGALGPAVRQALEEDLPNPFEIWDARKKTGGVTDANDPLLGGQAVIAHPFARYSAARLCVSFMSDSVSCRPARDLRGELPLVLDPERSEQRGSSRVLPLGHCFAVRGDRDRWNGISGSRLRAQRSSSCGVCEAVIHASTSSMRKRSARLPPTRYARSRPALASRLMVGSDTRA